MADPQADARPRPEVRPTRHRHWAKSLLGIVVVYLGICAIIGNVLVEYAVHPTRIPVPEQAFRTNSANILTKGTLMENAEITTRDNIQLKAWYVQPNPWNGRTVIILHGVGDNRQGTTAYGQLVANHGFAFLAPDARAHGESGGTVFSYGVKEAEDVREWGDWLRRTHTPHCLYGLGESMGGAVILQSLKYETHFCGVVAESSFSDFHTIALDRIGQWMKTGPWLANTLLRPAIGSAWIIARLRYGIDFDQASPILAVTNSHVPVLLIHGMLDSNIPPYHTKLLHEANRADVEFWLVPRAEHCESWDIAGVEFERRVLAEFGDGGR